MNLYPLKFKPRFVDKIWGGRKFETVLGKTLPPNMLVGESWELYDFPPGVVDKSPGWVSATISNGPLAGKTLHDIVVQFGPKVRGTVPLVGNHGQFPILIKFLDAREDLSVQVHPPQAYADTHPGAHLKSEAWYVLQHDAGSRILKGLVAGATRGDFEAAAVVGGVDRLIQSIPVQDGDCHYLPSGTVHALGAGILVAEVQTPSDTTFRVFDFNRIDPGTGKPRQLHVEQALDCIDFSGESEPAPAKTSGPRLVTSPYFHLDRLELNYGETRPVNAGQPVVWMMLAGEVEIRSDGATEPTSLKRGETVLFPAGVVNPIATALSQSQWLEVTFPQAK